MLLCNNDKILRTFPKKSSSLVNLPFLHMIWGGWHLSKTILKPRCRAAHWVEDDWHFSLPATDRMFWMRSPQLPRFRHNKWCFYQKWWRICILFGIYCTCWAHRWTFHKWSQCWPKPWAEQELLISIRTIYYLETERVLQGHFTNQLPSHIPLRLWWTEFIIIIK